jgi:hypothetical protein
MNATPTRPIRLSLEKSVLAVELFDLASNRVIATFHRPRSRCSFTEELVHGSFHVVLRLDWGQTTDGEPTLDMDAKRRTADGSLKVVPPKKNPSHHTSLSSLVSGSLAPRFYDLQYGTLRLRLVARKTFAATTSLSTYVVDGTASEHA